MNNTINQSNKQDRKNQHQMHPQHQVHQQQQTRQEQGLNKQDQNPNVLQGSLKYQDHEHPEARMFR